MTRQDPGGLVGALLRPCELRGFVELVKLRQGERDRVLILGIDCLGTFEPPAYKGWAGNGEEKSSAFLKSMLASGKPPDGAPTLRRCCQACEYPTPEGADIQIQILGADEPVLQAGTSRGEQCLAALGLPEVKSPQQRQAAVTALVSQRTASRDQLFREVEENLLPLEKLLGELAPCINCYNCRDVCPVCYCKSCVMDSSTLEHPASQYMRWAQRKGVIKMPSETLFYHMTRMAHMSTSCVGCGQCSSGCPMSIRVGEIFRTVAKRTQAAFEYVPGRSLEEPLPMATFREEELQPR
jgi:formate dehydrogenase subunit beta